MIKKQTGVTVHVGSLRTKLHILGVTFVTALLDYEIVLYITWLFLIQHQQHPILNHCIHIIQAFKKE